MNADQESSFSAIDVNEGKVEDAAFHEYRQGLFCSERRCASDQITRVSLGDRRVAGADLFVAGLACEFFRGYLAIAVHQYDEGLAAFVFHYQGFNDGVFCDIEFAGRDLGAAVILIVVEMC